MRCKIMYLLSYLDGSSAPLELEELRGHVVQDVKIAEEFVGILTAGKWAPVVPLWCLTNTAVMLSYSVRLEEHIFSFTHTIGLERG